MGKYYNLFLDDDPKRIPHQLTWIKLPHYEWTIVRNYEDFVNTILRDGVPNCVSFDHDLCQEHYDEYSWAHDKNSPTCGTIRYELFTVKCGYDCAKWLANYCIDNKHSLPLYYVHTLNGVGAANIFKVMENARTLLSGNE